MTTVIRIGIATIEYSNRGRWLITRYPDGSEVPACPNGRTEDINMAKNLGYRHADGAPAEVAAALWQMTSDHDLMHSWLAVNYDGLDYSPVLWHLAHPCASPQWEHSARQVAREEDRVLRAQEMLHKHRPRPWMRAPYWQGGE